MILKRDFHKLTEQPFDLVVVGGGIYGAWAAWDAALRGWRVALFEKNDFASATSANSLKIIHGGLRYLQHGDIRRMRESIRERMLLMRVAPHLVHPLPCIMPTYGHGVRGREALALALKLNDVISFDRNRLTDPQKYLPKGTVVSRRRALELVPGIQTEHLTGAAVWYDAQIYNSERLIIHLLRGAVEQGACVYNYAPVTELLREQDRIAGVRLQDALAGTRYNVRAQMVLNATGPWLNEILRLAGLPAARCNQPFCKALNLVADRRAPAQLAVGIPSRRPYQDSDALINKGTRFLFMTPWRRYMLLGTEYLHFSGHPDVLTVSEDEVEAFLQEFNAAYPGLRLRREEITLVHAGLVPMEPPQNAGSDITLTKHFRILDHASVDGVRGLISILSVKYTTARQVVERALDLAARQLSRKSTCRTDQVPIPGGDIERFGEFVQEEIARRPWGLDAETIRHLIYNYGTLYPEVLECIEEDMRWRDRVYAQEAVLWAEVVHAVRKEMALTLNDIVRRRTELGTGQCPPRHVLQDIADVAGSLLGWDEPRKQQEIESVLAAYRPVQLPRSDRSRTGVHRGVAPSD